jgi:amidase
MDDPTRGTATELVALLRRRTLSSRELLERFVARVEGQNPALNAIVTLGLEQARARADAADAALARGEVWGPLHGLPMTVKDTFETAGLRTTAGYTPLAAHVPRADAVAVRRLVDAGAVVFGKTNVPVLAGDWQSYNPIFGTTNNPWDVTRVPGGSSGGAAAAVAAGLTALELGSDIGGSIRVPAHWCGVYGHKPSHGIVPQRGHIPGPPGARSEPDLNVVGPLARGATDLELVLDVIAGPLDDRAVGWRLALPPARRGRLRDYRVAAWLDDAAFPVDAEVRACLDGAVHALREAGVAVDETARPDFGLREAMDVYVNLLWPVLVAGYPHEVFDGLVELAARTPADAPGYLPRLARAGTARHREWLATHEARERLRGQLADFFRRVDVLLMPVNQVAAVPHDQSEPMSGRVVRVNGEDRPYFDLLAWIGVATLTHHPATAVPIGRTEAGLPVGLQVVGPYLEDRTTIDFARRLGEVVGGYAPPP